MICYVFICVFIFYIIDPYQPYLHIVEEPIDKFRFRYKSEMSGTHGSLSGMKSDRSRKQTYPTVEVSFWGLLCNLKKLYFLLQLLLNTLFTIK